jgi:hypothetical protein
VTLSSRLFRMELSPSRIKTKCCRAFPPVAAGPIASPLKRLHKGQIGAFGLRSYRDRRNAPGVRLLRPNRSPYAASSGLRLRSYRDRCNAPGVHFLRPNRGLRTASSGLLLRSYRDRRNTLACIFSGQIGAFAPLQEDFTSGHDDK